MLLKEEELDLFAVPFKEKYEHIVSMIQVYDPDSGLLRPYNPTLSQWGIIGSILEEPNTRVQTICPTQYGKSLAVGIAAMISAVLLGDKIAIVAPSTDKAKIIMDVAIDHLDDNAIFAEAIKLEKGDTIERIKKYRQKTRLSFSSGGEIRVYSADSRNKQATTRALMGFGARKVIVDESSLIDDDLYSTIKRMVGGYKDGFLFEIGNPFINNHFRRTWENERYLRIFVDCYKALSEGRYSKAFIDEMREEEFFSILYECKFPDLDETNKAGLYKLLSPYTHFNLTTQKYNLEPNSLLGVDVARAGKDHTVFVKRGGNFARVVWRKQRTKLDEIAMMVVRFIKGGLPAENVFIDETGMGGYLVDFLSERNYDVIGVNSNHPSSDQERFFNIRSEMFWEMKLWLEDKGQDNLKPLVGSPAMWKELTYLTYSFFNGKIKLTSKDEIKAVNRGQSPDIADALALTFAYPRTIHKPTREKTLTERIWDADMAKIEAEKIAREQDPMDII